MRITRLLGVVVAAGLGAAAAAQTAPMKPDIPNFKAPTAEFDYERREVMVPMRDGVKLFTVLIVPKGAKRAPIILTRTPYHAANRAKRFVSPHMLSTLPLGDELFAPEGYIRVFQDVRGKYGSEGDYVMTRPLRGPLNDTPVDHSTDAYDTIDWLVKNVPESNGNVGMIGSSYEGFTVLMALINPHPALKAAVPMCPMVDGWKGDDWFHNGAFRQSNFRYIYAADHGARRRLADRHAACTTTTSCFSLRLRRRFRAPLRASRRCPTTRKSSSTPPTISTGARRHWTRSWRRSR